MPWRNPSQPGVQLAIARVLPSGRSPIAETQRDAREKERGQSADEPGRDVATQNDQARNCRGCGSGAEQVRRASRSELEKRKEG